MGNGLSGKRHVCVEAEGEPDGPGQVSLGWSDSELTGQGGSCPDQRGHSLRSLLSSGQWPNIGDSPESQAPQDGGSP